MTQSTSDQSSDHGDLAAILSGIAAVLDDVGHTLEEIETHVLDRMATGGQVEGAPPAVQAFDRLAQTVSDLSKVTAHIARAMPGPVLLPLAPLLAQVRLAMVAERLAGLHSTAGHRNAAEAKTDISLF